MWHEFGNCPKYTDLERASCATSWQDQGGFDIVRMNFHGVGVL